ncbi:MAG: bifunctional demethylmenaquinone methyltransferase/2-methoxy-6-polyprenyl-1,4-benzoquinol methylase UbiE [Candidatus Lernaella stagnicola]|nr:bifunctional demethylmenaquinone methyltransferase/2-methoxy-6-polyprenyl-1,4-benzoquinol methylase UbiE [Candidatus Lernaella stagnicola]
MTDTDNRAIKQPEQIKALFDRLAPRYELNDHLFSMGIDVWWRQVTARRLAPQVPGPLLDGATGSAQLAAAVARRYPDRRVVGLDFSPGMLAVGRAKLPRLGLDQRVELVEGDLLDLPFDDGFFAAATVAFGVRNVADRRRCLHNFFRVLKPGGRLLVLEFSMPTLPVLAPLYRWYFGAVMPILARLLRSYEAYRYLHESVRSFPPAERFVAMLREAGFEKVRVTPLTLGIAQLFEAESPLC